MISRDMLLDFLVDYKASIKDDVGVLFKKYDREKHADFLKRSVLSRKGQIAACDSLIDTIIQDKDADVNDLVYDNLHYMEGASRFWWDVFQFYRFDK